MTVNWPTAALDPVGRLHTLAAGVRGAHVVERVVAAPFDEVWPLLADLEGELAQIVPDTRRLRVTRTDGDRIEGVATSQHGLRACFDGVLRPGWCLLQSRFVLVGIAARPTAGGTLVAFTGGLRIPGRPALFPLGVRREGRRTLERLSARVEGV
ncbi:hypothetical protein ACWGQ5_30710 [Streptomyces sp. NPDC055722]